MTASGSPPLPTSKRPGMPPSMNSTVSHGHNHTTGGEGGGSRASRLFSRMHHGVTLGKRKKRAAHDYDYDKLNSVLPEAPPKPLFNWEDDEGLLAELAVIDGNNYFYNSYNNVNDAPKYTFFKRGGNVPSLNSMKTTQSIGKLALWNALKFLIITTLILTPTLVAVLLVYKDPTSDAGSLQAGHVRIWWPGSEYFWREIVLPLVVLLEVAIGMYLLGTLVFVLWIRFTESKDVSSEDDDDEDDDEESDDLLDDSNIFSKGPSSFLSSLRVSFKRFTKSTWFQIVVKASRPIFFTAYLLVLILLLPILLVESKETQMEFYLRRSLLVLLVGSVLFSLKQLMVNHIVANFYATAYNTRLTDFCFLVAVFERLLTHLQKDDQSAKQRETSHASLHLFSSPLKKKPRNPSNVPSPNKDPIENLSASFKKLHPIKMPLKVPVGCYKQYNYFMNVKRSETGARLNNRATVIISFSSKAGCKELGKQLFNHYKTVDTEGNELLVLDSSFKGLFNMADYLAFLGNPMIMPAFTPFQWKQLMIRLHLDCVSLQKSLNDHGQAVHKLDRLLNVFIFIITGFSIPYLFDLEIRPLMSVIFSLVVGGAFIFGSSASALFTSLVWLFVTHPFDIGDRVMLATNPTESLFVHEIGLFITVFQRWDGILLYYPNALLTPLSITNIKRSPPVMREYMDVQVQMITPKQHECLALRLMAFVKEHPTDYEPIQPLIGALEILDGSRYTKLAFILYHKSNFQDGVIRAQRHTDFLLTLKDLLVELGITLRGVLRIEITHEDVEACKS